MTLPVPVLDDRTYDQLRTELLERIPAYTPEWTNQQASDPGVTLLELFAFLGENLLFRFNQIPDATQLWLLRMLEVPPLPARPSSGIVVLDQQSPSTGAPPQVDLGSSLLAGSVAFETLEDLDCLPVTGRALVKTPASAPTTPELLAAVERAIDARDGLAVGEEPTFYTPTTLQTGPGATGVATLQVAPSINGTLWIAVIAASGVTSAELLVPGSGPLDGATLNIGLWLADQFPTMAQRNPCSGLNPPAPTVGGPVAPAVTWQISTTDTDPVSLDPVYEQVSLVADSTAGFTQGGVVRLTIPSGLVTGGHPVGIPVPSDPDIAGTGDWPPVLDDNPDVVCWLRAYAASTSTTIPDLALVSLNAASVDQMESAEPEFVGVGNGMPSQSMRLINPSVDPTTLVLQVQMQGVWTTWTLVDTFAGAGADDLLYTLDAASGTVTCGNTLQGRAFQIGEQVRALSYRWGGGAAGNVGAAAINTISTGAPVTVGNPLPLSGGADAESIEQAMTRIPEELSNHDRAVTAEDFKNLATIQGVGRAETLPTFYPPDFDTQAAGVVTVVVWPSSDPVHPLAPTPDVALLSAVCAELDPRRLITTELYVVPPTYHEVAVAIGVHALPGYSGNAVCNWVQQVLTQYLSPLPPFGPSGAGWPLGRAVFGPELMAAALQVEGIDYLEPVRLADRPPGTTTWNEVDPSTPIVLEVWEVAELASITVVVGPALAPGASVPAPPPPASLLPIPVPLDEC